jgi:F-type H+-transporting ATPase subunit delta
MYTSNLKVSSQYAKSLLKQAREAEMLENIYRDALLFKKVVEENKKLLKVLESPIITSQKKLAILNELFKNRLHKITLNLFQLISHATREALIPTVMDIFIEQYYDYKKIKVASVTTTFKLSNDLISYFKTMVKSLMPCKEVILNEYINPSIQGGFILRVADQQIDNSLANKLHKLKAQFSVNEY